MQFNYGGILSVHDKPPVDPYSTFEYRFRYGLFEFFPNSSLLSFARDLQTVWKTIFDRFFLNLNSYD